MSPKVTLSSRGALLFALIFIFASEWFSPALAQSGPPTIHAVMNVASYADQSVSPGEMIVIFGTDLGPDQLTHLKVGSDGKLVNSLEGVQIFASGLPCPLIYVSKYQLSAMVPYGISQLPSTRFQVVVNGVTSNSWNMPVTPSMPGIFTADASGKGQAAMTNSDGSYNDASHPANRGSWITFYLTGEGPINIGGVDGRIIWDATSLTLPVKVRIAGYEAELLYAGSAPGNVNGFAQINAIVPPSLPYGGNLPLTVEIGGIQSRQEVTVAVAGPAAPTPGVPGNVTANPLGNDMIRLSWSGVGPAASRYLIERSDDGGGFRQIAAVDGASNSFDDRGLGDSRNFKYRIQAFNTWGMSAYSGVAEAAFTNPGPAPSAISVTLSPATSNLRGGGSQQFSAVVTGTSNTAVSWAISPAVGTISTSGRYVAPSTINAMQVITVTARSAADATKTATALITLTPPDVISLSISPSTATVRAGSSQTFTAQVNGSTSSPLTWTITPNVGTLAINGTSAIYTAPASVSVQQAVQVAVRSTANPAAAATATVTLPADPPANPNLRSFWQPQAAPAVEAVTTDKAGITLGLRFTSDVPGQVVGIRFFKGASNTGNHVGTLWSSTGTILGQVSFAESSASGWQQANFATPIVISANTTYVVSYFAPNGNYAEDQLYAWQNLNSVPLHASSGSSGVYAYGSTTTFPNTSWNNSNYWVDVVFLPSAAPPPPATYSISGRVSGSSATLSLSGPKTGTATTNASGDYTFTGLSNGLYVISPSRTGYSFSPSSTSVTIASASVTGINFSGTALPPAPRSVLLTWNSSPSPNVVGYNLYRAASSAGPYSKITSKPVAATTYTDTNVSIGNTYYYYATAIDSGGLEGAYSNQASTPVN